MKASQGLLYSLSLAHGAIGTAISCVEEMVTRGEKVPYLAIALNIIEIEERLNKLQEAAEEHRNINDDDDLTDPNEYYAQNN